MTVSHHRLLARLTQLPLALCLGTALATSASAQSLLTLVEQAQSYDAAWRSAEAQLRAASSSADQARAGLLPSAALSAGVSTARTEISPSQIGMTLPNRNVSISASQPLYRPANRISLEQSQRGIDIAQAKLDAATQDLLVRVSQAYFDVLAAQDTLTFVRAQKTAVSEQLAAAQRNFEVGTATVTDQREAQASFDLVRAREIAAENDLHVKRLALDQLVGHNATQPWPLAEPVQLPALDSQEVTHWVEQAEQQQPQVRQAQIALDVARLETAKARTGHLPTVDLQASHGINHSPNGSASSLGVNTRSTNTSVGVALNLPLFAGFAVQNRVKETLAREEQAQADLEALQRNVAQATRAAYFGVQSGHSQVRALQAAEASSQSALEANQLGYKVGVRINMDVLNAQSQLYETKRDLAVARYNLLLGQLKLRQAAGVLSLDDLRSLDALLARP